MIVVRRLVDEFQENSENHSLLLDIVQRAHSARQRAHELFVTSREPLVSVAGQLAGILSNCITKDILPTLTPTRRTRFPGTAPG
jgi:hypothetical protein